MIPIDHHNVSLMAAQAYTNQNCFDDQEFMDDLKRVKYLKRLFRQYLDGGELKVRLVLNHVICFYNVFEASVATRILFLKLHEFYPQLLPFLDLTGFTPRKVNIGVDSRTLEPDALERDPAVVRALEEME